MIYEGNAKHIEIISSKGYLCTKKVPNQVDFNYLDTTLDITSPFITLRFITSESYLIIKSLLVKTERICDANVFPVALPNPDPSMDFNTLIAHAEKRIIERMKYEMDQFKSKIEERIRSIETKVEYLIELQNSKHATNAAIE